jgi:poly-beta-hydroxyalkanoate depolymerase
MKYTREVVITNKAQCRLCEDIIESKSRHDYVRCSCGEIAVDGGTDYRKRSAGNLSNILELSEYHTEEFESSI